VRLAYVLVPLAAACLASALLVHVPAVAMAATVLRWAIVLALSTAVFVAVHRSLASLLPLAAMLELSITFPGPAPSRYAVAKDAGDPAKLQEIVARAQRGDPMVNLADANAAREILGLVAALGAHDLQTRGHSERVRIYTDLIAEQLRLPPEDRGHLRWAALLHDVGKLKVPAAVLNKTTPLGDSDWRLIRGHASAGVRITRPLSSWLGTWVETIAQHHERYDGTGYPLGLAGDRICLGARIVAVADAFDVMTAARSYRKPISRAAALRELSDCAGTQFDPRVVRAMLAVSTPRLRLAMGPLSWLGATPFLAASQGAVTAAAQTTVGVVAAGTVMVAAPVAAASPDATPPPVPVAAGHHGVSATEPGTVRPSSRPTTRSSAAPSTQPTPASGAPSAQPSPGGSGKPSTKPTPSGSGKPSTKPTPSGSGKPSKPPTPTPSPTPTKTQNPNSGKPSKTPKPSPSSRPTPTGHGHH
jgi:putative nucleotidyltransferase with HDIG domain